MTRTARSLPLAAAANLLYATGGSAAAATLWSEESSGDLSNERGTRRR
jgi:hypothetical protein